MKSRIKALVSCGSLVILSAVLGSTSWGASLSNQKQQLAQKQQKTKELHNQAQKTSQKIVQQKHKTATLKQSLKQTQHTLQSTQQKISSNKQQEQFLQAKVSKLNQNIQATQAELSKDTDAFNQMLVASYEDGSIPYVNVIFNSNSFSDLLSRLNLISMVSKSEHTLVKHVDTLQKQLKKQRSDENTAVRQLQLKASQLNQMKLTQVSLQTQQKNSITEVSRNISALQQEETQFSEQMHLTQQQASDLQKQIAEEEAIQSTQSGNIVEGDLRYHDVSAQKLYNYVQNYDKRNFGTPSALSLGDIEIICQWARSYNVNPILMVSITGQEESFVPKAWSAWSKIEKNPFNVYYSWMWTTKVHPSWTINNTADYAANTVRHKLSTPPPSGEDPFVWLNDPKNPWGLYATDRNWSAGVESFFKSISSYANS